MEELSTSSVLLLGQRCRWDGFPFMASVALGCKWGWG